MRKASTRLATSGPGCGGAGTRQEKAGPHGKLAAVTVTDPRPSWPWACPGCPSATRALEAGGLHFDVSKIPNAQAITAWQFPGVTVFYDDGHALRWESHSSIDVPALARSISSSPGQLPNPPERE